MALISCPECEAKVSDQAAACPKCGYPMDFQTCPECQQQIPGEAVACPECGHPMPAATAASPSRDPFPADPQAATGGNALAAPPAPPASIEREPGPLEWYFRVWQRFGEMRGRSRRKEYWWFALFNFLAFCFLSILDGALNLYGADIGLDPDTALGLFSGLYTLAVLIPGICVGVRRMHDTGKSGWLVLILLVPLVGWITFLILAAQDSDPGPNRFGPSPKYAAAVATPEPAWHR